MPGRPRAPSRRRESSAFAAVAPGQNGAQRAPEPSARATRRFRAHRASPAPGHMRDLTHHDHLDNTVPAQGRNTKLQKRFSQGARPPFRSRELGPGPGPGPPSPAADSLSGRPPAPRSGPGPDHPAPRGTRMPAASVKNAPSPSRSAETKPDDKRLAPFRTDPERSTLTPRRDSRGRARAPSQSHPEPQTAPTRRTFRLGPSARAAGGDAPESTALLTRGGTQPGQGARHPPRSMAATLAAARGRLSLSSENAGAARDARHNGRRRRHCATRASAVLTKERAATAPPQRPLVRQVPGVAPGPASGSQRVRLEPGLRIHPHPVTLGAPSILSAPTQRLPRAVLHPAQPPHARLPPTQPPPHARLPPSPSHAHSLRAPPLWDGRVRDRRRFSRLLLPRNIVDRPRQWPPGLQSPVEKTQTLRVLPRAARPLPPRWRPDAGLSTSPPPASSTGISRKGPAASRPMYQVEFELARTALKQLKGPLSDQDKLLLYSWYKQATRGDCHLPAPTASDPKAKAKWEAWTANQGMSRMDAMRAYVAKVEELTRKEAG
ncbi:hypothetical protein P7K49_010171 [Saguinus oedipus]|uniref:ACB domain-containing protein n=1 Tax=Saguinus oedipus TaxID=9490 RepID=A0ABQ9VMM9_SAGOE|nr:hypothetical protein P7K49_010171 [Saguinus oedipus]